MAADGSSIRVAMMGGFVRGRPEDLARQQVLRFKICKDKEGKSMLPLHEAVEETMFPLYLEGCFTQNNSDKEVTNISSFTSVPIQGWKRVQASSGCRIYVYSQADEWIELRKARDEYKSHFEVMKPSSAREQNRAPKLPSDASAPQGKNQGTSHRNESVVTKGMSVSIFYKNCTHNATVKKVNEAAGKVQFEIDGNHNMHFLSLDEFTLAQSLAGSKPSKDFDKGGTRVAPKRKEREPSTLDTSTSLPSDRRLAKKIPATSAFDLIRQQRLAKSKHVVDEDPPSPPQPLRNNGLEGPPVSDSDSDDEREVSPTMDEMSEEEEEEDKGEEEDKPNEMVCAECDDGGNLLQCDGICMRSFHRKCVGLHKHEFKLMTLSSEPWKCPNCTLHIQQCFMCKEDGYAGGSTQKLNGVKLRQVFKCMIYECGKFYHPDCVSKDKKTATSEAHKLNVVDEHFGICPLHTCKGCGKLDKPNSSDIQEHLIPCRRCVTAYHPKCVPKKLRDIAGYYENESILRLWTPTEKEPGYRELYLGTAKEYMEERQWQDQVSIPFLYCRKHEMGPPTFEAPNHILPIFSAGLMKMWRESIKTNETQLKTNITDRRSQYVRSDNLVIKSSLLGEDAERGHGGQEVEGPDAGDLLRFSKVRPAAVEGGEEEGCEDAEMVEWGEQKVEETEVEKEERGVKLREADVKMNARLQRIEAFSDSAVTSASVLNALKVPKPYTVHSTGHTKISEERIKELTRIAQLASQRRQDPQMRDQLLTKAYISEIKRYDQQLRISMLPFRHKAKYSSFGRHFTNPEKLEVVTDYLMFFVNNGDCIVDFSCGSNEFLAMMEAKAPAAGMERSLSFVGFDIIPASNHANFVLKSWFDLQAGSLPPGDQLVVGLNPPFGVNNKLAIQFIQESCKFQPRVIVLIVPRDTAIPVPHLERNQGKYHPRDCVYNIAHFDTSLMEGKAFFFPGSHSNSTGNNVLDHNKTAPAFIILTRNGFNYSDSWRLDDSRDMNSF